MSWNRETWTRTHSYDFETPFELEKGQWVAHQTRLNGHLHRMSGDGKQAMGGTWDEDCVACVASQAYLKTLLPTYLDATTSVPTPTPETNWVTL